MKSGRKVSEMPSDKKCVEILNGYSEGGKYTIENALPLIRYLQEMVNISDEEYNIREEKEILRVVRRIVSASMILNSSSFFNWYLFQFSICLGVSVFAIGTRTGKNCTTASSTKRRTTSTSVQNCCGVKS